jgi:hypothetical protein
MTEIETTKAPQDPRTVARSMFLGEAMNRPRRCTTVVVEGIEVEVRNPTLAQRREISSMSGDDGVKLEIAAAIMCSYVPGTNNRIFDPADMDALLGTETGGFAWLLAKAALELMKASVTTAKEAAGK